MRAIAAVSAYAIPALGLVFALGAPYPAMALDQAARVDVAEKEPYGKYLTDGEGRSLYLFEADSERSSTCYDACADAWPPLLTGGEPVAGEGIDQSLLATVERTDGSTQVAYGGWPLYYFVQDQQPGDTKGQDVEGFGAEWYLISPEGKKVEED